MYWSVYVSPEGTTQGRVKPDILVSIRTKHQVNAVGVGEGVWEKQKVEQGLGEHWQQTVEEEGTGENEFLSFQLHNRSLECLRDTQTVMEYSRTEHHCHTLLEQTLSPPSACNRLEIERDRERDRELSNNITQKSLAVCICLCLYAGEISNLKCRQ